MGHGRFSLDANGLTSGPEKGRTTMDWCRRTFVAFLVGATAFAVVVDPRSVAFGQSSPNASQPLSTGDVGQPPPASVSDDQAEKLVQILTDRGVPRKQAQAVVNSLSPDDIQVLAANPEMIQAAGDDAGTVFLAVIIVLLVILIIVIVA
jgi:hypothetical protein